MKINNTMIKDHKSLTFGVRKTDTIDSFVSEIKNDNPKISKFIEQLPIIKKIQECDTFETLTNKLNQDRSILENKQKVGLGTYRTFKSFINSIGVKILKNLNELNIFPDSFNIKTEDQTQNKNEINNIIKVLKVRIKKNNYFKNNKEKIKEQQKEYKKVNKDIISERNKVYYETNKNKIKERHKAYRIANKDKINEYRIANKDKLNEYQKEYYKANKDKLNEYQKEYYKANKDKINEYRIANKDKLNEYQKEYYKANKDKVRESQKKYCEANKDKIREWQRKYREAKKLENSKKIS